MRNGCERVDRPQQVRSLESKAYFASILGRASTYKHRKLKSVVRHWLDGLADPGNSAAAVGDFEPDARPWGSYSAKKRSNSRPRSGPTGEIISA